MSAQWPSAVVSTSQLYVAVNELQNNLSGAINTSVTTIGLNSTTGFPSVGLVLIDNEVIQYTGISGNNLTSCTRAFDGTTAASHSSGAVVSFAFCAGHYNNAANEIIAVETYLNTVLGKGTTVTSTEFGYLSGVTSAIQTQLTAKAPTASPTFSGTITTPLTANRAVVTGASGVLAASAATDTEISYVSGVTSAIQTQLGNKLANNADASMNSHKITSLSNGTASSDAAAFGQIKVLQIVQATTTTAFSVNNSAYQTTNLTASITPTSASNRILILAQGVMSTQAGNTADCIASLFRGSTDLSNGSGFQLADGAITGAVLAPASFCYVDSPATTSSTTYSVKIKNDGSATVGFGNGTQTQVMILIEVV